MGTKSFFQKKGVKRIRTVNNSRRPSNIKKDAQNFPKAGNSL